MKAIIKTLILLFTVAVCHAQEKKVLDVAAFEKAVQSGKIQLLDVRTPDEYKSGYIKGATNADWNNQPVFLAAAAKLNKNQPVYVYCLSGVRSGKAADWMTANGFKEVINLDGGIKAWNAAGKKLETK